MNISSFFAIAIEDDEFWATITKKSRVETSYIESYENANYTAKPKIIRTHATDGVFWIVIFADQFVSYSISSMSLAVLIFSLLSYHETSATLKLVLK